MDWLHISTDSVTIQLQLQVWQALLTSVGVIASGWKTVEWLVAVFGWLNSKRKTWASNRLAAEAVKLQELHDAKLRNEGIDRLLREFGPPVRGK